jgi:hypothetical protein
MAENTFEDFMRRYGPRDGAYPVLDIGPHPEAWPIIVARFGDRTAVLQMCGLAAGDETASALSIIVHAFVDERIARAGVYGMEDGRRYHVLDDTTPGTSAGWPAVQGVTILVGEQNTRTITGD